MLQNFLAAIGTGVPVLAGHFYVTLQLCRFQVRDEYCGSHSHAGVLAVRVLRFQNCASPHIMALILWEATARKLASLLQSLSLVLGSR